MSLARIVTSTPAQFSALAEYLRGRGYGVEFVEPGEPGAAPADLEMNVQGCTPEEAMARGRDAAEAAPTPGVRRAIAYDITGRPVAFADDEEPAPKDGNAIGRGWSGLVSALRETQENLRLSLGHLREWFEEGRQSLRERRARQSQERTQALEEREARKLAQAEQARQQQEEMERQAALERRRIREQEEARRAEAERSRREQEENARRLQLAAAGARLREQEQARREQVAQRERELMERFRREAREDAVRERFQIEQASAQQKLQPAQAAIAHRAAPTQAPRRYRRDNDWRAAAITAVVLALLVTLGYAAYENRTPAAPLSNRALVRSQSVSEPVPFGAAVAAPQAPRAASQPNPALPQKDVAPASPAPSPAHRIRRSRHSRTADEGIAEDEVVVHHSGSTTPARTAAAGATPKHISDLEP